MPRLFQLIAEKHPDHLCSECKMTHRGEGPRIVYMSNMYVHGTCEQDILRLIGVYHVLYHGTGLKAGSQRLIVAEGLEASKHITIAEICNQLEAKRYSNVTVEVSYHMLVPWLKGVVAALCEFPGAKLECVEIA